MIDFFLKVADRIATVEAKYRIPKAGSEAFKRLVAQMQSAMATEGTGKVVLWTFKAPTQAELTVLLAELGEGASTVQFVEGLMGLNNWVRFFFIGI